VFLLNGSGHPTAVTAAEQNLKGFGFDVLGSKHTPKTSVTTIACLKRYAMDAYNVSLVFGPTAVIKPALRHAIKGTQRADCVVTLGTSAGFSLPSGAPQEIEVVVLNGSDQTGAGAAVTNELRGLGYAVVRTGNTTPRDGTVIACRQKFADEAELIADVVGRDAMVQDASSVPEFEAGFDCIVLLGG
jgi:hypothetical protein